MTPPPVETVSERPELLRIEGLQSGYGEVTVLWGIDLTVRQGDITALIGSNGAGKSTLMRTISALVRTPGACGGAVSRSTGKIRRRCWRTASRTFPRGAGCSAPCRSRTT